VNRKIPPDAFEFYYGLGPGRSYQAVADHYDVTKRAVTAFAGRNGWTERLDAIEQEAREKSDKRIVESLDEMNERHLKLVRVIQGKALEALKAMPIRSAVEADKAIDMTIRQERVIRGEASERTAVSLEDVIRREHDRWLVDGGEEEGSDAET